MIKVGSLFDGIGGTPLCATLYGAEPTWASEIEKFPITERTVCDRWMYRLFKEGKMRYKNRWDFLFGGGKR